MQANESGMDGVSDKRLAVADELLTNGMNETLYTHAAYALMRGGQSVHRQFFGAATPETVYDLASLTKPTATATSILQLAERGKLHLLQSVNRFFEDEFGPLPHLSNVEIRHLLTHTSGLPPIPRWPKEDAKPTRRDRIVTTLTTPTLRPPGVGFTYSDTGFILLGEIVARVGGLTLDKHFAEHIAGPLGLTHTGFLPKGPTAPTGKDIAPGVVHDPRAKDLGGVAGHAGLFGTLNDVLTYAETIRTGGGPILSRAAAARMSVSQIEASVGGQSLGWFCAGNDYLPSGDFFSDRAFGHSGFTGTVILIDPAFDVTLVLLTNRVVNEDEDGSRFLKLRRLWLNAVAAALT